MLVDVLNWSLFRDWNDIGFIPGWGLSPFTVWTVQNITYRFSQKVGIFFQEPSWNCVGTLCFSWVERRKLLKSWHFSHKCDFVSKVFCYNSLLKRVTSGSKFPIGVRKLVLIKFAQSTADIPLAPSSWCNDFRMVKIQPVSELLSIIPLACNP